MSVPSAGERRPVTTLFADIVGSTTLAERMDPEDWSEVVGEAVRRMSIAIERYGGRVEQVLGDGVLAFFGLRIAHEDDPQRAVRAGLRLVEDMRRYSDETEASLGLRLPVRVGVSTGPVVVRDSGNAAAGTDLTALGDPVNVAARLQGEARPDTVLVTAETYEFVAAATESRRVGPVTLKGKAESVDAYEIVRWTGGVGRSRGVAGLDSPMVGRDKELVSLLSVLAPVRAGLGRAAVILGEPGIGKSRMISELREAADAASQPFAWHEARCLSYGQSIPHHLAISIARSLLGLPAVEFGAEPVADESIVQDPHPEIDPYLAHLLALEAPAAASAEVAKLDPAVLQGRYIDALRSAIDVAARATPIVVICEDIHWADAASVELLERLMPHLRSLPVLLLILARPDRDVPGWSLVSSARDVYGDVLVDLRLGPLTRTDSRALVGNLLAIESLADAARDHILSRTDGNPFFIEEVIRMLVDRGAIERRDGRWVATRPIDPGEIPETLHGLLLARIDRLPADARELLRVASVIGRRFPFSLLSEVMARR